MLGYYRKFISKFADAARPMTELARKDKKFEWSDNCQSGFEYSKISLGGTLVWGETAPFWDKLSCTMKFLIIILIWGDKHVMQGSGRLKSGP